MHDVQVSAKLSKICTSSSSDDVVTETIPSIQVSIMLRSAIETRWGLRATDDRANKTSRNTHAVKICSKHQPIPQRANPRSLMLISCEN